MAAHVRRNLFRGLLLILPLAVTVWVVSALFGVVNRYATPRLQEIVVWTGIEAPEGPVSRAFFVLASLAITAVLIYLIGAIGSNFTGRRWVRWFESGILRIPVVRHVYGPMRQLLDAFASDEGSHFSRVVLVEYPRKGVWTIGFVTTEKRQTIAEGTPAVPVFLPTTPNPTSGWLVYFHDEELTDIPLSVEESIKLIVSGGIVGPDQFGRTPR